jgi:hypothetical protein
VPTPLVIRVTEEGTAPKEVRDPRRWLLPVGGGLQRWREAGEGRAVLLAREHVQLGQQRNTVHQRAPRQRSRVPWVMLSPPAAFASVCFTQTQGL